MLTAAALRRAAHSVPGPAGTPDEDEAPRFTLTVTQVVASMSAAVVAAFLGAQLGVAGTVTGAAIASIVSVVGSAVIGHSLLLTRRKVGETVQHVRAASPGRGPGGPDADETVLLTGLTGRIDGPHPAARPSKRRGRWSRPGRVRWLLVGLAASIAVFVAALGAVTAVEAVKGAPISGGPGGFTVLGGSGGDSSNDDGSSGAVQSAPVTVTETTTAPPTATGSSAPATTSAPATSSSVPATSVESSSAPSTTSAAPTSAAPTTNPATGTGRAGVTEAAPSSAAG